MKAKDFDNTFDCGESVLSELDLEKAIRADQAQRHMNLDRTQMQSYSESVLDIDGSCRDINFDGLTWTGAAAVLQWLIDNSTDFVAHSEGDKVSEPIRTGEQVCNAARNSGFCHLALRNTVGVFSQLQAFVCPDDDVPFVEITFFPDNIISDQYSIERFVVFVNNLMAIGRANNYFVRYENASWRFGDTSEHSGVIFTFHDIETIA